DRPPKSAPDVFYHLTVVDTAGRATEVAPIQIIRDPGREPNSRIRIPESKRQGAPTARDGGTTVTRRALAAASRLTLPRVTATASGLEGDVTGDGVFDLRDPLALCRFVSGAIPGLPAPQNGEVSFDGALNRDDVDVMMLAMIGVPLPPPPLVAAPSTLDFGDVRTGTERTLDVTLKNDGAAPARVDSIALGAGTSGAFSIVSALQTPATIPGGGRATVTIRYAPAAVGADVGSLVILSPGGRPVVQLSGRGVAPVLAVTPPALGFGDVLVGDESLLDVTLENDGSADLQVMSIAPGPLTSADYSIHAAPATPFTLPAGGRATVTIRSE